MVYKRGIQRKDEPEEIPELKVKCNVCKRVKSLASVKEREETHRGRPRQQMHWICNRCKRKQKLNSIWSKVKGFLQASRLQTAPITASVIMLAYLMGNIKYQPVWLTILLPLIGILIHMFS